MKNNTNKDELAGQLKIYLNKHRHDKNFWSRDLIGIIIKNFCNGRGNFKNSPRGNPRKGARIKRENQARKNGEVE